MEELLKLHNSEFTQEDISLIRGLISSSGHRGRTYISKELCRIWNWRTPSGHLRDITCREVLRKLDARGVIVLPAMLKPARRAGYKNRTSLPSNLDTHPLFCSLSELLPLRIELVRGTQKEKFYNGLIGAYHYLGYHQGSGEQLKYIIQSENKLLGCIGFSSSAFKIAPRDKFIGWSHEVRKKHLPAVVNNNRFLILPWIDVPNLASYILGVVARRIREDWVSYYKRDLVLLETFVECQRFLGTCYKAANWIYLGQTKGRGRNDRHTQYGLPVKDIYVYPLVKDFRQRLQK